MKGKQLDLIRDASLVAGNTEAAGNAGGNSDGRPFLGVHFACCEVYSRVYLNREETHYLGNCPRCAKQVRFQVGTGGTDARFFTAR